MSKGSSLKSLLKGDHSFYKGTILGSMCTRPHPVGRRIFNRYMDANIGDPGLVPGMVALEEEYIQILAELLHGNYEVVGKIVTGGTEANILAMWSARELGKPHQKEVILSESAHFSFDKAANLLGLTLHKIPTDDCGKVRIDLVKEALTENTLALVGIAGTTSLGICDSIEELSQIASDRNLYMHVDAAFGGFVYPFLPESQQPSWDFIHPGVNSITIDPHKMGQAPIPTGCILFKDKHFARGIQIPVGYLSGGFSLNNTLTGTRSGAAVAAAFALWRYFGVKGYQKEVAKSMKLTHWFLEKLKNIPQANLVCTPEINVVGIRPIDLPFQPLIHGLRKKGWALSEWPGFFRIVIMPHVSKRMLKAFLKDLSKVCQEI